MTKNLGFVQAIIVSLSPPTNLFQIWFDDNIGQKKHKVYDFTTLSWVDLGSGGGGAAVWGGITGLLSNQTDLQTALNGKLSTSLASGFILFGDPSNVAQAAAISGDIILSSTAVATIQNNAVTTAKIANSNVTLAKIQDVNSQVLLGRGTAGVGSVEVITLGSGLSLTGTVLSATASVSIPLSQIAYGTGSGITSSTRFTFGTLSGVDGLIITGIGTTTSKGIFYRNSALAEVFSVQDNGLVNITDALFAASTSTKPNLTLAQGVAVTSPASGNLWHTSTGLFFRFGATSVNLMSLPNANLAIMAANTIKANNTAGAAVPSDLAISANSIPLRVGTGNISSFTVNTNSVIGRELGDIVNIPIQQAILGFDTLVAGTRTIFDARITTSSYAVTGVSNTGAFTSPLRYTSAAGQMTFTSGNIADTATFSYLIVF